MSNGWRKFLTFVLGALFVLAFIAFIGGLVVRRDLLDPTLYTSALAENDVYERVYVDIFGDPAMQNKLAEALDIESNLIAGETYAELVSVFNLVLPPPKMQNTAEEFFTKLTAYLAGETDKLDPNFPLDEALDSEVLADRITNALAAGAVQIAAAAAPAVAQTTAAVDEAELASYLSDVSQGKLAAIPASALNASTRGLTAEDRTQLVDTLVEKAEISADAQVRLQMEAALAEDDLAGAVTLATRELLRKRIANKTGELEQRLAESDVLNGVEQVAITLDTTGETVLGVLNLLRSYASAIKVMLIPLIIILALLLIGIVWLHNDDVASMLRAAGWTFAASGGLVLLLWLGIAFWLRNTLQRTLDVDRGMPAGVEGIVDDVVVSLTLNIWNALWGIAFFWFIIGLVILAFGYSRPLMGFLRKLLAPVWDHRAWALGGILVLLVLTPLVVRLFTADTHAARLPCNGHPELCDRPANEVAYVTTHNAMSIAQLGWLWPSHDGAISDQLDAGVRALLIDTHYADTLDKIDDALGGLPQEAQDVARRAIDSGRFEGAGEGSFLCHMTCGLGATNLTDTLIVIRTFLEKNPREVLFVIIQDAISPTDTEAAFKAASLDEYIFNHQPGIPWPTLREMIDSNQRLVVMAEEHGPPPDWYQNVWDNTMETPYTFINYDDFVCDPNRGGEDAPFFMLNHWIQRGSPDRVDAAIVNEYDFLLARAHQCAEERGKMPNFIAVNFYQNGDVFSVVDTLNGVGGEDQ